MGAIVFNIAKGRANELGHLNAANDALTWIILQSSGLESDATLQDYATLAAILGSTNLEATFTGYSRIKHSSGLTVTVDNTANTQSLDDTVDPSWSPTTNQAIAAVVALYDPDTTADPHDSALVPIFKDDFVLTTPTSGSITYQVASGGFFVAS